MFECVDVIDGLIAVGKNRQRSQGEGPAVPAVNEMVIREEFDAR